MMPYGYGLIRPGKLSETIVSQSLAAAIIKETPFGIQKIVKQKNNTGNG